MRFLWTTLIAGLSSIFSLAAQTPTLTQTVRGTVTDAVLQQPLPGATVQLWQDSSQWGAITNLDGNFMLAEVPPGRYSLTVRFVGFEARTLSNIVVTSGKAVVLTVTLEEAVYATEEVVIEGRAARGEASNEMARLSARSLAPEAINRFAGARSDPSRMVSNYAGVVGGGDQRNDIIVRGNSPMGVLWRVEGVDIPNPNHFQVTGNTGGVFSILNNNLLASSDFLTGAFPAEYGNKTAAVFDVGLRKGNTERREHTFQVGLNGLEAATEGPLGGKGSYLVSGRLFNWTLMNALGVNVGANGIPQFMDGTAKVDFSLKRGSVSVWTMGGQSSLYNQLSNQDTTEWEGLSVDDDNFGSRMSVVGGRYRHLYSDELGGELRLAWSQQVVTNEKEEVFRDGFSWQRESLRYAERTAQARYELTYQSDPRGFIKAGGAFYHIEVDARMSDLREADTTQQVRLATEGNTQQVQFYTQGQWKFAPRWELTAGAYYQYYAQSDQHALEPRVALRYQPAEGHTLTLGYGRHSQSQPLLYNFFWFHQANDDSTQSNINLGFTQAHHGVLGYRVNLGPNWQVRSEAYYQALSDIPVLDDPTVGWYAMANLGADFGFNAQPNTVNAGVGRNYGLELTVERSLQQGYYLLATVSAFRSQYQALDGVWRSTAFDLGWVANLLAGYEWTLDPSGAKVINVDVKMNASGGRPYIPIDLDASRLADSEIPDLDRAWEARLAPYFRLDFKASYQINRPRSAHQIFVAADNLTGYANEFYRYYDVDSRQIETAYQFGLFPYLGYRVNF